MSEHADRQHSFSDVESEDLVQYKRVSLLAVAALVGGIASMAAVASPFMWWLPLLTLTLSIAALVSISKQRDILVGRKAAIIGLWLALLLGSAAVAHHAARHTFLYRGARLRCEKWLQLVVDGRLQEAHQLQLGPDGRMPFGANMSDYYAENEEASEDFQGFTESDVIQQLTDIGPAARIQYVGDRGVFVEVSSGSRSEIIMQTYNIQYDDDGKPESLPLKVGIERKRDPDTGEVFWHVISADPPD